MRHLECGSLFHLIIGVLSGCCWSLLVNSATSPVTSSTIQCFPYGHCNSSQEGVHGLDCYKKYSEKKTRCVWKPGRRASNETKYTLVIDQESRDHCETFRNISGTSHVFLPYQKYNMTIYVVDTSNDERNCTMDTFRGIPESLVRCNPPKQMVFERHSRQLMIRVSWEEKIHVDKFLVNYTELDRLSWTQVECTEKGKCIVGNLTSSVSYMVQVKCVTSRQCRQCPWSDALTVPPELTSTPVIEVFDVIPPRNGKRLIIARWKIANNESVAGYRVTVAKVSGELTETLITSQPAVWLSLTGSAYHINISAFNSAATSRPAQRSVPMVQNTNEIDVDGNLNVTFKDNSSFHISWNSSLNRAYSCFSVEWGIKEGQELFFDPFHQKNSKKTVKAPLEPYKRYVFLLNARPDKDTCDLKRINNSESTIGRAEAYAKQGTPTSAPGNVTCPEVSSTSLVIAWSAVPEAETRGFLQGYIIYQKENGKGQNLSVGANVNHVTLSNLKSQTVYEVQLSAFTAVGEGVRSDSFYFETKGRDYSIIGGAVGGIVGGIVIPLLVARLCSRLFQRAKKLFWPSIPNPGNSNAIQKIDGDFEPEVLEPLNRERLAQIEESHTSSLLIIEGAAEISRPSIQYDEEEASPAGHKTEEDCPSLGEEMEPTPDAMETSENRPALPPVVSDYTTMELFQQTMSQPASTAQAEPHSNGMQADQPKTDQTDPLLVKPEQDYIRQALCHTLFQSHPNAADELNDMVHFSVY